jgi:hypothetical protein
VDLVNRDGGGRGVVQALQHGTVVKYANNAMFTEVSGTT